MRVSIDWLKEYVEVQEEPRQLAERLTGVGVKVEAITPLNQGVRGVVVGRVEGIERHPNADALWVCTVDVGRPERLTIVTGAQNVRAGDLVPVAVPGATIAGGKAIGVAEFRGFRSEGMLCSPEELGIDEGGDGILILPPDAPVGADAAQYLGLDDTVLELELTANYAAHCQAMLGVAQEYGALTGQTPRWPEPRVAEGPDPVTGAPDIRDLIRIRIDAPDLCHRYAGRIIRGVKVGPSPGWLQARLRAAGMRPINNIVDVTNYVMLELGQPLHAFDYDRIAGREVIVRRARPGERIVTLDGQERVLDEEVLVIADGEKPQVIAGVMGAEDSEVRPETTTVFLEAAIFDGINNRRTSRRYGIFSEAASRFSRGVDPSGVIRALNRAAELIVQVAGGQVVAGVIDLYPRVAVPRLIPVRLRRLWTVTGLALEERQVKEYLERLGFAVLPAEDLLFTPAGEEGAGGDGDGAAGGGEAGGADALAALAERDPVWAAMARVSPVPADPANRSAWLQAARQEIARARETVRPWAADEAGGLGAVGANPRLDVAIEADIAEEVARLHGYNRIEATLPQGPAVRGGRSPQAAITLRARRILAGAGLVEVMTHSLTHPRVFDRLGLPADSPLRQAVTIQNPLYEERSILRTLLAPALLDVAQYNVNRQVRDLQIFEISRVFHPRPGETLPREEERLGILALGQARPKTWDQPARPVDFYYLKGVVEHLLDSLGVPREAWRLEAGTVPFFHPGRTALLFVGGEEVGCLGELHPDVQAAWDLPGRAYLAELRWAPIVEAVTEAPGYTPVPRYPAVGRDVAMVIGQEVPAARVEAAIRQAGGDLLEEVRLFDLYQGPPVPPGKRSLAYSLTYRAPDRTLTDAEVEAVHNRVRQALQDLGAELRS
nr:MAG: phenylalanine--tRNA ligase subunit beta [Bacillota bacterium]